MDTRAQNFQHDLPSAGPISNSWEFPPNIVKQLESQLQKLVDKAFERVSRRSIPPTGSPGRSLVDFHPILTPVFHLNLTPPLLQ